MKNGFNVKIFKICIYSGSLLFLRSFFIEVKHFILDYIFLELERLLLNSISPIFNQTKLSFTSNKNALPVVHKEKSKTETISFEGKTTLDLPKTQSNPIKEPLSSDNPFANTDFSNLIFTNLENEA